MSITFEIIIPTFGDISWKQTAEKRAIPSAFRQNGGTIVTPSHADTLSAARNDPGLASEADYLVFLDADDQLEDGYVESAALTIAATDADVVVPYVQKVESDGTATQPPKLLDPQSWAHGALCVVGSPIRTELFKRLGGFREMPMYEDWDLFWTCHQRGALFVESPNTIYRYWQTPVSRTRGDHPDRGKYLHDIRVAHGVHMGSGRWG